MQRFQFPLDTVLGWRRSQFEVAEAQLRGLLAEKAQVEAEVARLDASVEAERTAVQHSGVGIAERQAFDGYVRWAKLQRQRLLNRLGECEQRIAAQRAAVLEARRAVELLDKLRAKKLVEWQVAADREIEQLAADSYLARLSRGAP